MFDPPMEYPDSNEQAADFSSLRDEYMAAVRALDRARRELKLWFGTVDEKDWGGVAIKATDEAIVLATQALSTPRARAVLEQGETT